jgi:hypothetical protein
MKHLYFGLASLLVTLFSHAQYSQNFDTLIATGTGTYDKLPEGWGIYEVGTSSAADGKYSVNDGGSNAGNTYSYGTTGSTERALGSIASGTNGPTIGAIFFNETENALTSLTITFTLEQWRYGGPSTTRLEGVKEVIPFSYSLDATSISNTAPGTWVSVAELNLESIIATGAARALNGNLAENRKTISYTITGINISSGGSILIRWSNLDSPGADDGLAIDDFSISGGFAPGVLTSGATNTGGGSGGGGGTSTGTSTSTPIFLSKVQKDSSFLHLYGNLHGHSTHSDGNPSTLQPIDDYNYARITAAGMDFLGISEHNHSTAGLQISDYKIGAAQADAVNGQLNGAGQPFITLHGMEWGTISGGGHVLVYGFLDSLINWEPGNFDIFVQKGDYLTLFDKIRNNPGAFATLAHPNSSDYTGLTGGYKGIADSAVVSVAVESGPAFTTATNYSAYPTSLAYMTYYRNLLKQGYRVGAQMDQDNHEMTFGTANGNRMVVLSKERTREALVRGIQAMRIYASNDYNASVSFSINNFILGSSILSPSNLSGTVVHTDADGEGVSLIQLYAGTVRGADAALIGTSVSSTLNFTTMQGEGETWYYYAVITQADGNKIVTSPIWLTRAAGSALPVRLLDFTATPNSQKQVDVKWSTAFEQNSDYFLVERSSDGRTFQSIGKVPAKGTAANYSLLDASPYQGVNYYRLKQVDRDGRSTESSIVKVNLKPRLVLTLSPNPSSGLVGVKTNSGANEKTMVQVVDMAGNRVYHQQHSGNNFTLDLTRLPAGSYVIRVGDEIEQLIISK